MREPSPLSNPELIALSDRNLAESLREHARWVSAGSIVEHGDTLRTVSSTRFPAGMFNAAMCLREPPADPDAWLCELKLHYSTLGRGFSVYTRAHVDGALAEACLRAGMVRGGAPPGMVCEAPIAENGGPAARIELVEDVARLQALADVEAHAYVSMGLPEPVTRKLLGEPERLLSPCWSFMLAHDEQGPKAAAMLLLAHGVAGIYWVGTMPEARGRGLGAAVTRAITNLAFRRGARAVVLQASTDGEPVYRKLGFREITRYPWFVQFGPQAA